jgi:hypothetical protein
MTHPLLLLLLLLRAACRDADRVAGLLEANGIYNTKLLVNRVRPDMIQKNDMMSVRDVQVRGSVCCAVPCCGCGIRLDVCVHVLCLCL